MPASRPTIAFTSGCFDLLHEGHKHLLWRMNGLSPEVSVVVGLNSDGYIRRKKRREPANTAAVRSANLLNTGLVDDVVEFDEDGPLELILKYRPDFIVVGDDYSMDQVVGAKEVEEWGGKVVLVPRLDGYSTTAIIRNSHGKAEVWENGRKVGVQG